MKVGYFVIRNEGVHGGKSGLPLVREKSGKIKVREKLANFGIG